MNISVIGTGYVGLVTGVCLAEIGHQVTCIDINEEKVALLRQGIPPIYEDGLEELLHRNNTNGRLHFTISYEEALQNSQIVYITVGSPPKQDGSADLRFVDAVCRSLAQHLRQDTIIVTKSTVPVGTNEHIKQTIVNNLIENVTIDVVSNPEFLRQGNAIYDTFNGERIVIGADNPGALDIIERINQPFDIPIVRTDLRSAEMIKYASNAFLATKISFINEMANLSEKVGANIDDVSYAMGLDKRIGKDFLQAGIGYGGSCFPKDTHALLSIGRKSNYYMPIIESVIHVNQNQSKYFVEKMIQRLGDVTGKTIALLGLAFKPNTDDMRGAPSITVVKELLKKGANIKAFDPIASENAKKVLPAQIDLTASIQEAISGADCAVILTDWKEIKEYKVRDYKKHLSNPIIFDGRNCFTREEMQEHNIEYHSVGRQVVNGKDVTHHLL
ncbi:UDP-glucose/GDP-mannose dehydrogenase family protein [Aquibacillus koreensis]|uniref:UDP-glucose 6-dehydrogenase n=1 Tax=Aquibacillus koreensis TaxID=279446 RepID=A0A9X3WJJ0_9BACI|nr:UDP-glucose/GDP-mannose dehydrogenase family protein [Aquibacillus koreensis]MCT2535117.1 UDP-glucose/GDP-mannose dehydrogenase family protein [Aquibacillus koreensis]MDC3419760.1 UDP-glucose/GDP-mannose dehydrogenase family protein [Aquibacillus koreensis]